MSIGEHKETPPPPSSTTIAQSRTRKQHTHQRQEGYQRLLRDHKKTKDKQKNTKITQKSHSPNTAKRLPIRALISSPPPIPPLPLLLARTKRIIKNSLLHPLRRHLRREIMSHLRPARAGQGVPHAALVPGIHRGREGVVRVRRRGSSLGACGGQLAATDRVGVVAVIRHGGLAARAWLLGRTGLARAGAAGEVGAGLVLSLIHI